MFKKLKLKKFKKRFLIYWMIIIPVVIFVILFYILIIKDLPSPTKLTSSNFPQSSKIYDRNNKLLFTIYADRNQTFIPLSEIPKDVQNATIAIEDKDFYKHGAVDLRGITRAFYATIFKKDLQGGSTLTQQLVKNTLLTPERTVQRKIKEVILAYITEALYSKDKILEMYLNQVPYGGTTYGIDAASMTYFGKKAKDLTLAESALLAGLPAAPTVYSPFGAYPELAKSRQESILKNMLEQGYINNNQYQKALNEKLVYKKISNEIKAPHFVLYVKDLLEKKYGKETVEQGGLKVITSLDLDIQNYAQDTVASEVAKLRGSNVTNGSSLVTNPSTGEILAMVGSRDYFSDETDGNVNITIQNRQPGSSIKPINFATGLILGHTAATLFIDEAECYPSGPKSFCPRNYDGRYHGPVLMREALANSYNIPAVQMLKLNTVESMMATATAMGITTFDDPERYGLSLTLGGGEVRMIDMATAFGVFANQGYRIDLHPILKITDKNNKVLEEYKAPKSPIFGKKVIPSEVAFIISHILQDNGARTPAFGGNSQLKIGNNPVSVKTGTTNDYRDNWTIGYTPDLLVVSWVGNNDNSAMRGITSGVTGAAPIWNKIMTYLLEDKQVSLPVQPPNVVKKYVCSTSGLLPPSQEGGEACPVRLEYFIKGTEPTRVHPGRTKVFINKDTGDLAREGQTENIEEKDEIVVTDKLNNRYCLTCPHPTPSPAP